MTHKEFISSLGIGLIAFTSFAQSGKMKLPVVDVHGKQYYVYEAKKNQTFFNIANDFKWDLEELMRINSKVLSPMAKGTKIYYPCVPEREKGTDTPLDSEEFIEPLTHLVKKGETVYSISLMYKIPIEKLYSMNPGSRAGIKAGELLKVKDTAIAPTSNENPEFYEIKRGDTLYQLARTFNTTVAAILNNNPGISEDNFRAGERLKVPRYGEGLKIETSVVEEPTVVGFSSYKVEKKDTWDSIAEKTGVSVEDLKNANGGKNNLKSNQIIGVPELALDSVTKTVITEDPRELTLTGVSEIYGDVHKIVSSKDSMMEMRVGIVMFDPTSKKDLDFTRGFLTGVNKVKNSSYRLNVKVFDGRKSHDALIDSLGSYNPSIIFTTYEKNTPEFFADYALVSRVPVINTFDLKDETFMTNPYFVNILTPSNYFNDEVVNTLYNRYQDSKLVVVGAENDSNDMLLSILENKWGDSKILRFTSVEALEEFPFGSGSYLVFGNVSKKDDISNLVESVGKLKEDNMNVTINIVGRPSWIVYDESLKDTFHKADLYIPARFYYDKGSEDAKQFISEYHQLFNMTPAKSFPMYSTMGYDEALYFIPSWVSTGGDINNFKQSNSTVQSDFDLIRLENWSGMMNPMVYLVRFTPYGTIEKQKVK
ncbi:MAG: LysM peptidoglycan-binding domain-containing protein [Bacteroides sp.]|nr:LysM peptidoglycan-binding domain-containing protein [Bacteroides sp.]